MIQEKRYKFYNIRKKKPGVSIILLVFSLLTLLGLSALVIDLGIILNQRYEMQKAVESAALLAASEYEAYWASIFIMPNESLITDSDSGIAAQHYHALKNINQVLFQGKEQAPLNVELKPSSRAVKVESTFNVPTYFLGVLGITSVQIPAKAAAVASPVFLSSRFPRPAGSIVSGVSSSYRDTHIRDPLGGTSGSAKTYNHNNSFNNIYGKPDGKALSLGPGGHITIRLPAMIYDGKGFDFIIYERGHAEGYFVYAGVDADPTNPYISAANPGGGIQWVNISCTGIPLYVKSGYTIDAYKTTVTVNGSSTTDYKFYGSGIFDLGMKCSDGGTEFYDGTDSTDAPRIKNVKYLKIIDDNVEDGFLIQPKFGMEASQPAAIPMLIPGEHSSFTPGADIDAIEILHHSRLISVKEFDSGDSDEDGLLDTVELMFGLDPGVVDTDGDTISDLLEREGYMIRSTLNSDATLVGSSGMLPIIFKEYFGSDLCPPTMEVDLRN